MTTITLIESKEPIVVSRSFIQPPLPKDKGRALNASAGRTIHRLPPQKDKVIHNRLASLLAQGRELKINQLIENLQIGPLAQAPETLEWIAQFMAIDQNQLEDRALFLGILVIRHIRPALVKGLDLQERRTLLEYEDLCREILQQSLPYGEQVENFLQTCEKDLLQEKLLREQCERVQAEADAQTAALRSIAIESNSRINKARDLQEGRLVLLQNTRKETHLVVSDRLNAVTQEVDHLNKKMLVSANNLNEFDRQDEANLPVNSLEELL